jgi:hypothetical protein
MDMPNLTFSSGSYNNTPFQLYCLLFVYSCEFGACPRNSDVTGVDCDVVVRGMGVGLVETLPEDSVFGRVDEQEVRRMGTGGD